MFLLHCHKFIYIFEKLAALSFFNAKGNRSVGNLFHYISNKNIDFFSNKAQHLRGALELLSRKTCVIGLKKNPLNLIFCHW